MREGQFADGIQLRFSSKQDVPIALRELAVGWNSRTTVNSKEKDTALHPNKAVLHEYVGGLTLCVCWDDVKAPKEICITIPYIIVDGLKISADGKYATEYDDGTGIDLLREFVGLHWAGNPVPVKPMVSRQKASNLDGSGFPKMLIDLASTLEVFYESGMSHASLTQQIPDYEMSVWLRQIVGDVYKDPDHFYDFLDRARELSESSPLNGMSYNDAVIRLQAETPKIYEFMSERGFLTREAA